MARFQLEGAVLGLRRTPYDFTDQQGQQVKGESLTLVLFDEASTTSHEVKVQRTAAGKFSELALGQVVVVDVLVSAILRNGNAALDIKAMDVCDAAA